MANSKLYLALLIVCLMVSCKHDNSSVYPATIGNEWRYNIHSFLSTDTSNTTYEYERVVSVIKDTTINNTSTVQFLSMDSSYQTGGAVWQNFYYINNSNGFYWFASDSPFVAYPEFKKAGIYAKDFQEQNSFKTNSISGGIAFISSPIQFLKFPIVQGDIWQQEAYGGQSSFKRKYIGQENIITPAGSFNCTKLLMFEDGNNDNQPDTSSNIVFEWYCDKGFIMRTDSFADGMGFKYIKQLTLESTNVK